MGQACLYAGLSPKTRERREYSHGEESSGLLARDSHHSFGDDLEHNQNRSDTGGLPRI